MKKIIIVALVVLGGCMSKTLNFNQPGQGAISFVPKNIVVLPVAAYGDFDNEAASELVSRVLPDELSKRGWFDNVIDPATVKVQIAKNQEVRANITTLLTTLQSTGVLDQESAKNLGRLLRADTLFYCDVSAFGRYVSGGSTYTKSSLAFKVIDTKNGTIVWKAGHRMDELCNILGCPSDEKVLRKLINYMLDFMPEALPSIGKIAK